MAAYCWVYDSRHLQADCQEPGSAPEPYARYSSMGYLYLFTPCTAQAYCAGSVSHTFCKAPKMRECTIRNESLPEIIMNDAIYLFLKLQSAFW